MAHDSTRPDDPPTTTQLREKQANWLVHLFQILFLSVLLLDLDGPFLSAHNERQNQTFDMARHVYRDGWTSVFTPKVSFSSPGFETQHFTAALQEVPFHGLIAWPLMRVTSHERAVVRLISGAFALLSIQLMFWILRFWLPPMASALGAGVWATAPLVLHFGQAPMPDILCSAGMLAAFWFALRGKLSASSASFLFAILAKVSVIVFGLPVLTALLVASHCQSRRDGLRLASLWGWAPLSGLILWEFLLYWFAPPSSMTVIGILAGRGGWSGLVSLWFYKFLLGCALPFGMGVLGFIGLIFAAREKRSMNPAVKWTIVISNLFYLLFVIRKVTEPQYILPPLAWCVMASAFGFNFLMDQLRVSALWRAALGLALLLHVIVALLFTVDLKTCRVPSYPDIERAAKLLPADARVLVLYLHYGASPAVWLDRNVLAVSDELPSGFPSKCAQAYRAGFTHFLILDIESWHAPRGNDGVFAMWTRLTQALLRKPPEAGQNNSGNASPGSPFHRYSDLVFSRVYDSPHVVLYSMASFPAKQALGESFVWP